MSIILIPQNQAAQYHLALYLTVLMYEFDCSRCFSSRQLSDVVLVLAVLAYLQVLQLCDTSNRRCKCCGWLS